MACDFGKKSQEGKSKVRGQIEEFTALGANRVVGESGSLLQSDFLLLT